MDGPARYLRNPAVSETELDGEFFLVEPASGEVFYLDAVSAGLWRLVAAPRTLEETIAVYRAAFPEADGRTVENDLRVALQTMLDRCLVVAAP